MPSETSLGRTMLAQGVIAPRLGEGKVSNLASWLMASAKLPNRIGNLPLSSRDRRSYGRTSPGGTSPDASHGAFCFSLHISLGSEVLGSQGTWLALLKAPVAAVEAERSWDEVRPVTCPVTAVFCSETLATEIFCASECGALDYPQRAILWIFLGQNEWPSFQKWRAQDSDYCITTLSPCCARRPISPVESPSCFPSKIYYSLENLQKGSRNKITSN